MEIDLPGRPMADGADSRPGSERALAFAFRGKLRDLKLDETAEAFVQVALLARARGIQSPLPAGGLWLSVDDRFSVILQTAASKNAPANGAAVMDRGEYIGFVALSGILVDAERLADLRASLAAAIRREAR